MEEIKVSKIKILNLNTKEIALVSIFSGIWITSQIYLGPLIGQVTHIHGVAQRLVGWLLMLILAELVGKFGRVSTMAVIAALATRLVRRSASLYTWVVGLGYALGGLIFDLLFFLPFAQRLQGKTRKFYIIGITVVSGLTVLIPYLFFKLEVLPFEAFILFIPSFIYSTIKGTVLSVLGTIMGLPAISQIRPWFTKIRED